MRLSPTTTHSRYLFYLTLTASLDFYCSPGVIKYMNDHLTKTKWLQNQLHGTFYMLQFYATTLMHVTFHVGSCAPEQGILANYRHCRGFSDQKPRSVAKAMAKSRSWCWFLKGTPPASYGIGAAFPQITWHKKQSFTKFAQTWFAHQILSTKIIAKYCCQRAFITLVFILCHFILCQKKLRHYTVYYSYHYTTTIYFEACSIILSCDEGLVKEIP